MDTPLEAIFRMSLNDSTWHFKLERVSDDRVSFDSAQALSKLL